MKCRLCSNPGTVLRTEFVNGHIEQFFYCRPCAESCGVLSGETLPPSGVIPGLQLEFDLKSHLGDLLPPSLLECPHCGWSSGELRKYQRVGCAGCYEFFKEDILVLLSHRHPSVSHSEVAPQTPKAPLPTPEIDRSKLQALLDKALKEERYEDAARLRDALRDGEAQEADAQHDSFNF